MAIALIVIVLVVAGLLALTGAGLIRQAPVKEPTAPVEDVATPYVEGVQAAFRIERAAWTAEQQIYAEAARHAAGLSLSERDRHA